MSFTVLSSANFLKELFLKALKILVCMFSPMSSWYWTIATCSLQVQPLIPDTHPECNCNTTPSLCCLCWLPVAACISLKALMHCNKAKNGREPSFDQSTAQLDSLHLYIHGRHVLLLFFVLVPRWWNDLPLAVRTAELLAVFKQRLKTNHFTEHLNKHFYSEKIPWLVCCVFFHVVLTSSRVVLIWCYFLSLTWWIMMMRIFFQRLESTSVSL